MSDLILFAALGIGTGTVYALIALGIVLIHKGTNSVNFAQGAIAGASAIYFAVATNAGVPVPRAFMTAILTAALGGVGFYFAVMRPLRNAPLLAKVISTLGLMVILQGVVSRVWPSPSVVAPPLFPSDSVNLYGVAFGRDRFYLLGTTVVLTALLWLVYRYTRLGRATRATAESEQGAMLLGYSPNLIGAANWAAGSALAALAGVLIAPIATLDINTLSLLVVPALAAALVGKFSSFAITAVTGLGIGVAQSVLTFTWDQPGVNQAFPFLVVIAAMVISGRVIPERGSWQLLRDPIAWDRPPRLLPWAPLTVATIAGLAFLSDTYRGAITTSIILTVIALSLVIVSGFVGQISLAQMAFAGVGGFATAKIAAIAGIPFPLPILLAGLVAVPVGVIIGLPALRVRGVSLAIVTLGAAVAMSAVVFQNASWTGGVSGSQVPSPGFGAFSLNAVQHPARYGLFCLGVAALAVAGVLTLRQSASGRRMLAVRANERAAAVVGIDVAQTKLTAFALSAFFAAVGGGLLAYQLGAVAFDRFSPLASVMLVAIVYIGGIATVRGAIFAGVITNGGLLFVALSQVPGLASWWIVLSGALLLVTVVTQPSGAVIAAEQTIRKLRSRSGDGGKSSGSTESDSGLVPVNHEGEERGFQSEERRRTRRGNRDVGVAAPERL